MGATSAAGPSIDWARRIHCWHQLGLVDEAEAEVKQWLAQEDQNLEATGQLAVICARRGDAVALAHTLQRLQAETVTDHLRDHVLEEVAWATLQAASRDGTLQQRVHALIGQASTRDTRALPALHAALSDPSPVVRSVAAQLSPMCWDLETSLLLEEQLRKERQPDVRQALIGALGRCGTPFALQELLQAMEGADAQEQVTALEAAVNHLGEVPHEMVQKCLRHARGGMRALAAHLALHLPHSSALTCCVKLLDDPQASVRRSAWEALASLPLQGKDWKKIQPHWRKIDQERDFAIANEAAGLALRFDGEAASQLLRKNLHSSIRQKSLQAMKALLRAGESSVPLFNEVAQKHTDRLLRMNALIGLLSHRVDTEQNLQKLLVEITQLDERVMPLKGGSHLSIAPSEAGHLPQIPNFPEALDLMVRLRLAHLVKSCGGPLPTQQISKWLEERRWGLSSAAAQLLLTEGDAEAAQSVKRLMDHPSQKVRLQAALVLAAVGRDESALDQLLAAGPIQDPEVEAQILEAAGSLATRRLMPLLTQKLSDPSPSVRVTAASSLLQVLAEASKVWEST